MPTTAPATRATTLFSLASARAYLTNQKSADEADPSDDARIGLIADGVSQRIESETRRIFVIRPVTEARDGDGTRTLRLRQFPVVSVAALTVANEPGGTPVALVNGTDYDINLTIGEIRLRASCFTRGFQNVAASYVAGFDAQDGPLLPADLVQAALDYAKFLYDRVANGAVAASSIRIGASDTVIVPGPPKDIGRVFDTWRAVAL